jgi:hypothetical protein
MVSNVACRDSPAAAPPYAVLKAVNVLALTLRGLPMAPCVGPASRHGENPAAIVRLRTISGCKPSYPAWVGSVTSAAGELIGPDG